MTYAPLPAALRLLAPIFAARLAMILAAVAGLVARRAPALAGLAVPLWGWLNRNAARCARLCRHAAAGRAWQRRAPRPAPQQSVGAAAGPSRVRLALPCRSAWLVRAMGAEAACYGGQLQALLDEPGMAGLLDAVPGLARLVNPLRRMLGLCPPRPAREAAVPAKAPAPVAAPVPFLAAPGLRRHVGGWPGAPDGPV